MVDNLGTTETQSLRLWLYPTVEQMGWPYGQAVLSGYYQPLATWEDARQLVAAESWPRNRTPGGIATLFGAARLAMVMASEHALPKIFTRQEHKRPIPYVSLLVLSVLVLFAWFEVVFAGLVTFLDQRREAGQGLGVRAKRPAEGRFQLIAQPAAFRGRDIRPEKVAKCRVVALAEDLLRQLLRVVGNPVRVQQVNPLFDVKGIAVNQHAVHIEDDGGGKRAAGFHRAPVA